MPAVLEVVVLSGLLPSIPEGENYLWYTNRGGGLQLFGWRTRYWSFLLKLAKSLPSWTIQAQPGSAIGPFHWRSRKLTTREMCRLQTPTAQLVEAAKRAADWLPGFASALHRDARPLVNLTPIAGLERHLHRRQGDARLALRAVREARCSSATAKDGRHDLEYRRPSARPVNATVPERCRRTVAIDGFPDPDLRRPRPRLAGLLRFVCAVG